MKTVALFGGSFNPPHTAHFEMASYIHHALGVDELWFLFSNNWQKDESAYAPMHHRIQMGRIMAAHYPHNTFVMSDIQNTLGTHLTYQVLSALKQQYPDIHFIWVMGADNLQSFHTWEHYKDIITSTPIAVLARPPYTAPSLNSPTATQYAALQTHQPQSLLTQNTGWCMLNNPPIEMASSDLLNKIKGGQTEFAAPFADVLSYIKTHNLYDV